MSIIDKGLRSRHLSLFAPELNYWGVDPSPLRGLIKFGNGLMKMVQTEVAHDIGFDKNLKIIVANRMHPASQRLVGFNIKRDLQGEATVLWGATLSNIDEKLRAFYLESQSLTLTKTCARKILHELRYAIHNKSILELLRVRYKLSSPRWD